MYPLIAGTVSPQWYSTVQHSLLPGGGTGGFAFIPAGVPSFLPPGAAAGGVPTSQAPASPPSVNVDDVVTVSDAADGAAGNNSESNNDNGEKQEANDEQREIVEDSSTDDLGDGDSVSVESV